MIMISRSPGTFPKIDHIMSHKTYLNKLERMEMIQCVFLDHNEIKLKINNRNIVGKSQYTWRLSNTFLNSTEVKEEISRVV